MWYPSTVTVPPTEEPVTLDEARQQCLVDSTDDNPLLTRLIKAARSYAERYCNARWARQTVTFQCDNFADFCRLPEAPLHSVEVIDYVDAHGDARVVGETVYEVRKDGLEPSIALKHGQSWPIIRPDSRISVVAVVGGVVPDDVKHAMLLFIDDAFNQRPNAKVDGWTMLDALLCNHRRGV